MNTFLILLCIAPFAVLAGYGVYRAVRWFIGWLAWGSSE